MSLAVTINAQIKSEQAVYWHDIVARVGCVWLNPVKCVSEPWVEVVTQNDHMAPQHLWPWRGSNQSSWLPVRMWGQTRCNSCLLQNSLGNVWPYASQVILSLFLSFCFFQKQQKKHQSPLREDYYLRISVVHCDTCTKKEYRLLLKSSFAKSRSPIELSTHTEYSSA